MNSQPDSKDQAVCFHQQVPRNYPEQLKIEVLICTHNRASLLEKALHSLEECKIPEDGQIGIFVVTNACTDDTISVLEQFRSHKAAVPLRWMQVPTPGKSHALNSALPRARGKIIAFVDDDHRVDPDYFTALLEGARRHLDADLFCGRILPDWDGSEPRWVHDEGPYRIYPLPVPRFDQGSSEKPLEIQKAVPGGGNLAIRQGLFERVGPFRTELGPKGHDLGGAEDIEWVKRAVKDGACLYYLPDMVQYHYVDSQRLTLGYLLRKAYRRSASTIECQPAGPLGIPPFMFRKAAGYLAKSLTSLNRDRRRFYLTRLAAALGEMKGARTKHKQEN